MPERESLVQYYIVDTTLGIRSKGKIGAQCAHGALLADVIYRRLQKLAAQDDADLTSRTTASRYHRWFDGQMTKIVLRGDPDVFEKAVKIYGRMAVTVVDSGFTEVPPGSKTVVVLPILDRAEVPEWLAELKLL